MCVIKLTKVFSYFAGVFFYLQRVSFLGCVVSICSVCVIKLTKVFSYFDLILQVFFSICSAFLFLVVLWAFAACALLN